MQGLLRTTAVVIGTVLSVLLWTLVEPEFDWVEGKTPILLKTLISVAIALFASSMLVTMFWKRNSNISSGAAIWTVGVATLVAILAIRNPDLFDGSAPEHVIITPTVAACGCAILLGAIEHIRRTAKPILYSGVLMGLPAIASLGWLASNGVISSQLIAGLFGGALPRWT